MVKHSCVLDSLKRFKYWPVFPMFVLVPSAHIGVHGLFHSLIISPPAASTENEVIIQQAVRGFSTARLHSVVFSWLRHPSAVEPHSPASPRTLLRLAPLPEFKRPGKKSKEHWPNQEHSHCSLFLTFLAKLDGL